MYFKYLRKSSGDWAAVYTERSVFKKKKKYFFKINTLQIPFVKDFWIESIQIIKIYRNYHITYQGRTVYHKSHTFVAQTRISFVLSHKY